MASSPDNGDPNSGNDDLKKLEIIDKFARRNEEVIIDEDNDSADDDDDSSAADVSNSEYSDEYVEYDDDDDYVSESEFIDMEQVHREYRKQILSEYQPLHKELYTMNPSMFFVPSFLKAFDPGNADKDESIRSIMSEPFPGLYTCDMLQPRFCEMLLDEVANIEKWTKENDFLVMRPNTMNNYGAILDDFGMEGTLDRLVEDFVRHISKVFFPDVGGFALDSHHGFVVEYGIDRDVELAFHVDDSEVTLNVCLGKQFTGGDLFFKGIRCEEHVNGEIYPEEVYDFTHSVGHAIIHHGHHRHGARATTSGSRSNLILWCRSSVFRDLGKHKDSLQLCGECKREKEGRLVHSIDWMEKRRCLKVKEMLLLESSLGDHEPGFCFTVVNSGCIPDN